jgi:hypothetical protein
MTLDAIEESRRACAEDVITHELTAVSDARSQELPALDVVFGDAVLYRDDRILRHELLEVAYLCLAQTLDALPRVVVDAVRVELTRGGIERESYVVTRFVGGAFDRLAD